MPRSPMRAVPWMAVSLTEMGRGPVWGGSELILGNARSVVAVGPLRCPRGQWISR